MHIQIDHRSPVPPYEQLRARIASLIATGDLAIGHRLPSVRQLARDLDLAPNTVVRAYHELSGHGLIEIEGRKGAFVAGPAVVPAGREIHQAAKAFVDQALRRGIGREAALAEVSRVLAAMYEPERLPGEVPSH